MEVILSGLAVCGAVVFTNPLDVIKTRLQLQGELQKKGTYQLHYKNLFQSVFTIAKADGVLALQRGLTPALYYQFVANGCRLGIYQLIDRSGGLRTPSGEVVMIRSLICGGLSGAIGTCIGSPLYMAKIQIQSRSSVAVGNQHNYKSTACCLQDAYKAGGIQSLWRGVGTAVCRSTVGSAAQLATFSKSKSFIESLEILNKNSLLVPFLAACMAGIVIGLVMTPFDVVTTRLYNDKKCVYKGMANCFMKTFQAEGLVGLYKGLSVVYVRNAPHTVISLMLWFQIHDLYYKFINQKNNM